MRLQHLEISGFKSFPERAQLAFDRGVTAIVGPNGCGKSNVIDAITWVLGEQSAKSLRGDRMEDVIFSGSDARKPTAAAEVRLYLAQVTASVPGTRGNGDGHGRDQERLPHVPVATEQDDLDPPPVITTTCPARGFSAPFPSLACSRDQYSMSKVSLSGIAR